jgi:hypothetical protein
LDFALPEALELGFYFPHQGLGVTERVTKLVAFTLEELDFNRHAPHVPESAKRRQGCGSPAVAGKANKPVVFAQLSGFGS